MSCTTDCHLGKKLTVAIQEELPSWVVVMVTPQYGYGDVAEEKSPPSTHMEVTLTLAPKRGDKSTDLTEKQRRELRDILISETFKSFIREMLGDHGWDDVRVTTNERVQRIGPKYVWLLRRKYLPEEAN